MVQFTLSVVEVPHPDILENSKYQNLIGSSEFGSAKITKL
jgi:hypothetical protein